MIHRFTELKVAEVTRALCHATPAGLAPVEPVAGAHPRVVETIRYRPALIEGLGAGDLADRHIPDRIWREDSELDTSNLASVRLGFDRIPRGEHGTVAGAHLSHLSGLESEISAASPLF